MNDLELFERLERARQDYAHPNNRRPDRYLLDGLEAERRKRLDRIRAGGEIAAPCLLPSLTDAIDEDRMDPELLDHLPDGSRIRDASMARVSPEQSAEELFGFVEYVKRDGAWFVRMIDREIPARLVFESWQAGRIECLTVGDPYLMPSNSEK